MRNALHLIAILALSMGTMASPMRSEPQEPSATMSASDLPAETPHGGIVVVANETGGPRQISGINGAVQWTVDRYQTAEMSLPDLQIAFHRDRSICGGFDGLHSGGQGHHQIDICVGGHLQRRVTLLHELAHVWVSEHLDDSDRKSFLELRGLLSWNDSSVAWEQRGTEQAAMIITWGLGDECVAPDDLAGDEMSTLLSAFEHLTGRSPVCGRV